MLGQNKQIAELEDIMVQNDLFKKFSLSKVGIFGSAARGEASNDIDILIEDNVDYRSLYLLREELQRLTNKRIDIVIAKYANPIVLHRARKEIVYVAKISCLTPIIWSGIIRIFIWDSTIKKMEKYVYLRTYVRYNVKYEGGNVSE